MAGAPAARSDVSLREGSTLRTIRRVTGGPYRLYPPADRGRVGSLIACCALAGCVGGSLCDFAWRGRTLPRSCLPRGLANLVLLHVLPRPSGPGLSSALARARPSPPSCRVAIGCSQRYGKLGGGNAKRNGVCGCCNKPERRATRRCARRYWHKSEHKPTHAGRSG